MFGHDGLGVDLDVLVRVVPSVFSCLLAHALRALLEQERAINLGEAEEEQGRDGEDPDRKDVAGPAPAEVRVNRQGATDDGADSWSAHDGDGVDGYRGAAHLRVPDIAQGGGHVADGRGAEDAAEEAADEDTGCVARGRDADAEEPETEHGWQHADSSAPDFAHGCP